MDPEWQNADSGHELRSRNRSAGVHPEPDSQSHDKRLPSYDKYRLLGLQHKGYHEPMYNSYINFFPKK